MSANIKKIMVDLDGTVANFHLEFSKILQGLYGEERVKLVTNKEQILNWDWHHWIGLSEQEVEKGFQVLDADPGFWTKLELLDKNDWNRFVETFNHHLTVDTYFLTIRRHTGGVSAAKQSAKWLKKHGWEHPHVIVSKQKGMVCNVLQAEYFVDDSGENCLDVIENAPNCKPYLLDYPHNRKISHSKVRRIYSLQEFIDDVRKGK